jgi:hypothetical protein
MEISKNNITRWALGENYFTFKYQWCALFKSIEISAVLSVSAWIMQQLVLLHEEFVDEWEDPAICCNSEGSFNQTSELVNFEWRISIPPKIISEVCEASVGCEILFIVR